MKSDDHALSYNALPVTSYTSRTAANATRPQTVEASHPNALRGRKASSATLQSLFSPENPSLIVPLIGSLFRFFLKFGEGSADVRTIRQTR